MIVFSFDYPPRDGGIARLTGEVVSAAVASGVSVEVVTQASEFSGLVVPEASTARVTASRPQRELAALMRVPGWRNEVVVSGIWYPEGLIAALGQPRFHAVLAHGMELMPSRSLWRRQLWAGLQRRTLTGAQVVIANSRYTAEWVRRTAPDAVIEVVPLAVDAARFTPDGRDAERARRGWEGKQVVLTVSRLAGYKAHDTVLRAIASIPASERSNLCYAIAGRGPAESSPRHRIVCGVARLCSGGRTGVALCSLGPLRAGDAGAGGDTGGGGIWPGLSGGAGLRHRRGGRPDGRHPRCGC